MAIRAHKKAATIGMHAKSEVMVASGVREAGRNARSSAKEYKSLPGKTFQNSTGIGDRKKMPIITGERIKNHSAVRKPAGELVILSCFSDFATIMRCVASSKSSSRPSHSSMIKATCRLPPRTRGASIIIMIPTPKKKRLKSLFSPARNEIELFAT